MLGTVLDRPSHQCVPTPHVMTALRAVRVVITTYRPRPWTWELEELFLRTGFASAAWRSGGGCGTTSADCSARSAARTAGSSPNTPTTPPCTACTCFPRPLGRRRPARRPADVRGRTTRQSERCVDPGRRRLRKEALGEHRAPRERGVPRYVLGEDHLGAGRVLAVQAAYGWSMRRGRPPSVTSARCRT